MEQLLKLLQDDTGIFVSFILFISIFIEITPVKINPLSFLIKWVGDSFNRDAREKLSSISLQLNDVSNRIDKIEINDMRSAILDFANSCMNERKHTKEEFEHIIDLHTQYEETIAKRGMRNGRVDLAFKYISELYDKCLHENSFLDKEAAYADNNETGRCIKPE